jgi:cytoskeletal protein CcmA (bactofilin family)
MLNKSNRDESLKKSDGTLNTVIGNGTYVKGEVRVESNIRVDGKFEGVLKANDTLVVGSTGELNAEIRVKNATVGGKIEGNLVATNSVVLEQNSELRGDLKTKSLIINEGAQLNGNCIMGEEARPANATPSALPNKASKPEEVGVK